jgi:hypothetical protein
MGFFDSVKNAAVKAKLNGEILLLDRDLAAKKKAFGVELYDKLEQINNARAVNISLCNAIEKKVSGPLGTCRMELKGLVDERDVKQRDAEKIGATRDNNKFAQTGQEKLQRAGKWVSDASSEAGLQMEITLLNRKIKHRKELFGEEVFDELVLGATHPESSSAVDGGSRSPPGVKKVLGIGKDITSGITTQLAKLSPVEQELQHIVDRAKSDAAYIQNERGRKEREIASLGS